MTSDLSIQLNKELALLLDVSQVFVQGRDRNYSLVRILESIGRHMDWSLGAYWHHDLHKQELACEARWHNDILSEDDVIRRNFSGKIRMGQCIPGFVVAEKRPFWVPDLKEEKIFRRHELANDLNLHSNFSFPVTGTQDVLGVIEFFSSDIRAPQQDLIETVTVIGNLIGQYVERKDVEERLRSSEDLFNLLMSNTEDYAILITDDKTVIREANIGAQKILGYKEEELVGEKADLIFNKEDRSKGAHVEEVTRAAQEGKSVDERWHVRKDGTLFWSHGMLISLRDSAGRLVGFTKIFRDFTERKRMMEQRRIDQELLAKANQELETRVHERTRDLEARTEQLARSNEELEQFAYVASHDLREPLRNVNGFSQMLDRKYHDRFDAEATEYLTYIREGVVRMNTLIDDLLQISRIGSAPLAMGQISMNEVVDQVFGDLRQRIEGAKADVTRDDLPMVVGNRTQLGRVVQNLLSNALKFRSGRPPKINISARAGEKEWTFMVSDNGIGIAPEYYDRIFVIFQRLHTRKEYPGTGIGLAVCRKIIQRHGGRIWVESKVNEGSTFYFTIPHRIEVRSR